MKQRGLKLAEAAETLEPHSMDLADSATDEFDHDMVLSEVSTGQDVLFEIDEALSRIRNGTYGFCAETGKPIALARLRAVPWTRFSLAAASRLEQRGALKQARLGAVASVRDTAKIELPEQDFADPDADKPSQDEALTQTKSPGDRKPRDR